MKETNQNISATISENIENMEELKALFASGMHVGYSRSSRHPKTAKFVHGVRNNIQIIDVRKISDSLERAKEFIRNLGKENKQILFVGSKEEARNPVEVIANRLEMPFVNLRWLGGTLTNFKEIRRRLDTLNELTANQATGDIMKFKKKERVRIEEKMKKMAQMFGGLHLMKSVPSALVVIDSKDEAIAVSEAKVKRLPVVALMNTDCNPLLAEYPVLGNDASRTSIVLFLESIASAYEEGKKMAEKKVSEEVTV